MHTFCKQECKHNNSNNIPENAHQFVALMDLPNNARILLKNTLSPKGQWV